MVGKLAAMQVADGLAGKEEAVERGQAQFRATAILAQQIHDEGERVVEVGVARAATASGQLVQALRRVVVQVAFTRGFVSIGSEEDVTILRHEEYDQAIDKAQQLAIIVLRREVARPQFVAQTLIVGRQKAAPQRLYRGLDAITQTVQSANALPLRLLQPAFQPALGGLRALET